MSDMADVKLCVLCLYWLPRDPELGSFGSKFCCLSCYGMRRRMYQALDGDTEGSRHVYDRLSRGQKWQFFRSFRRWIISPQGRDLEYEDLALKIERGEIQVEPLPALPPAQQPLAREEQSDQEQDQAQQEGQQQQGQLVGPMQQFWQQQQQQQRQQQSGNSSSGRSSSSTNGSSHRKVVVRVYGCSHDDDVDVHVRFTKRHRSS